MIVLTLQYPRYKKKTRPSKTPGLCTSKRLIVVTISHFPSCSMLLRKNYTHYKTVISMANALNYGNLTIGLNIGIASVGWAVLSDKGHIVDLGLRCFSAAEKIPEKTPLNTDRRIMRQARRRFARRSARLTALKKLFINVGLIQSNDSLLSNHATPWELRVKALDEKLCPADWARAVFHIVKNRGWFAYRKADVSSNGPMLSVMASLEKLLLEKGYRSVAELVQVDPLFSKAKRNKNYEFKNNWYRKHIEAELVTLFRLQRGFGNEFASAEIEKKVLAIFNRQKEVLTFEQMHQLVGNCAYEPKEKRASKATYSAERFVWLSKLNNLRINCNGENRFLTAAERQVLIDLPWKLASGVTYKKVRSVLGLSNEEFFVGLHLKDSTERKEESSQLFAATAFHTLRKAYSGSLEQLWEKRANDIDFLDNVASILTLCKTDEELRAHLGLLGCDTEEIEVLLNIGFQNFLQLSLKAIKRINLYLEEGKVYSDACSQAGYNIKKPGTQQKSKYLPSLSDKERKEIRNPVVSRSINQAIKVVNAIIEKYGSPSYINIEFACDVGKKPFQRVEIARNMKENESLWTDLSKEFEAIFKVRPNDIDLLKWRLYKEQDAKCAYSLKSIDVNRLLEKGYVEVDHIIPRSIAFDNSYNNKVLVFRKENEPKKQQTPYQYVRAVYGVDHWNKVVANVTTNNKLSMQKRTNMLKKYVSQVDYDVYRERILNDVRYITRFLASYIAHRLYFTGESKKPVRTPCGEITKQLRDLWGLNKQYKDCDLHHVVDAAIVASVNDGLINKISQYFANEENHSYQVDIESGEILQVFHSDNYRATMPWENFSHELVARLSASAQEECERLSHYTLEMIDCVKPVWVSRAVNRLGKGALHKRTISTKKYLSQSLTTKKIPLTELKLCHLGVDRRKSVEDKTGLMVGLDGPLNAPLVEALIERLKSNGDEPDKAFATPFYKPNAKGAVTAKSPIVRSVKIYEVCKGGFEVNNGIAANGTIVRVDIFLKKGKYYCVPLYQCDRRKSLEELPKHAANLKPRSEWDLMDETFDFVFSLYPNDMIELKTKKQTYRGYFAGVNVTGGKIDIMSHARFSNEGKEGLWRNLGVKVGVTSFKKFTVSVLGDVFEAPQEIRRGLT